MKSLEDKLLKVLSDLERARNLMPENQHKLALKYFRKGPNQNYSVAFEIFSMAAQQEYAPAMVYIARMYYEGLGVKQSTPKSVKFLKKASNLGSINAKCILGAVAKSGESPELPPESAVSYYTEAANLGSLFAKYCLADIYKNGTIVDKDHEKAIEIYNECILAEPISKNFGILAESYFGLIQCYLEKHYLEEANTVRDANYYKSSKIHKEKARFYLEEAAKLKNLVSSHIKENFDNALKVYSSILNEDEVDLSKMSYGEFRKKYYNKHPRIFLPTKKSEHLLYVDGIKNYFLKRDDAEEELEHSLQQKKELLEKRKIVLKNLIEHFEIAHDPEEVYVAQSCLNNIDDELYQFKDSYLIDYSSCVVNLNKYLEEILHHIFVVEMQNYKKEMLNSKIQKKENLIVKLTKKLSLEKLQNMNYLVNAVTINSKTSQFDKEKHMSLFSSFITKMIEQKTPKSTTRRLNTLNQYQTSNTIDQDEIDIINHINELNNDISLRDKLKVNESFQLGSLFDIAFVDHNANTSLEIPSQNKLNETVLSFTQSINPKLEKNEIYLKLHELLLKIEYFRVMIRNVASHKSILPQGLMEKGLNLCIVQESSIFNLLDELFGSHLENQIYYNDFQDYLDKSSSTLQVENIEDVINLSKEDFDSTI